MVKISNRNNDDFKSYTDKFLKPICCKYTVKVYAFVMTNSVKQCKLIEVNKSVKTDAWKSYVFVKRTMKNFSKNSSRQKNKKFFSGGR